MIGEKMSDKEKEIYNALKTVIDPELTVNLVDLGFIYDIQVEDRTAIIKMTLTIMGCPLTELLNKEITTAVTFGPQIEKCKINLVWYPQWTPDKMSRAARLILGIH